MKTNKFFQLLTLAICALAFAFVTGCEGPEGKVGPKGDPGAQGDKGDKGDKGDTGDQGIAGNVTCLECHAEDLIQIKQEEFHQSVHSAGAIAVDYAGGRASCARCHSHEGYLEFARTGKVSNDIQTPSAWECKTCHNIHTTFEQTDFAFRLGDPVALLASTATVDGENNNTCINCHQARRNYESYDSETTDKTYDRVFSGDDIATYTNASVGPAGTIDLEPAGTNGSIADSLRVTFDVPFATHAYINSTHAGPHHGPQGNTWAGVNGVGVPDGVIFEGHAPGCVACHMGPASGHSFNVTQDDYANCMECHTTSKEPALDAFKNRLLAVGTALEAIHAVHRDPSVDVTKEHLLHAYHPMYASLTKVQMQAWWNFMLLIEDRSYSAHNPVYQEAILSATEDALGL